MLRGAPQPRKTRSSLAGSLSLDRNVLTQASRSAECPRRYAGDDLAGTRAVGRVGRRGRPGRAARAAAPGAGDDAWASPAPPAVWLRVGLRLGLGFGSRSATGSSTGSSSSSGSGSGSGRVSSWRRPAVRPQCPRPRPPSTTARRGRRGLARRRSLGCSSGCSSACRAIAATSLGEGGLARSGRCACRPRGTAPRPTAAAAAAPRGSSSALLRLDRVLLDDRRRGPGTARSLAETPRAARCRSACGSSAPGRAR